MQKTKNLSCKLPNFKPESIQCLALKITDDKLEAAALERLLADKEERFRLLDLPRFQNAVQTLGQQLEDTLYCYVIVRKQLIQAGINSQATAIYLSNIWSGYRETGILPNLDNCNGQFVETVDILRELNSVNGYEKFELLAMSGNYFLFLMAFFEGYFKELEANMNTPVAYYEAFARISYRAARDHGLSDEFELKEVCHHLSESFHTIKGALSKLGQAEAIHIN
ncbi:MAG: hypothetical protein ACI81V_000777 [Lentimonas sp.]|jgi:hypothetical protein